MKYALIFFLGLLSSAFAQDAGQAGSGVEPSFPVVPLNSDSVTLAGIRYEFSQSVVEFNIETGLGIVSSAREELKGANSDQATRRASDLLDRGLLELACDIIAAENFAKKSERLSDLLQKVENSLKDQPLPARVVTPMQLYIAVAGRSFRNADGMPVKPGDITRVLTFGDLVAEAKERILLRSKASE